MHVAKTYHKAKIPATLLRLTQAHLQNQSQCDKRNPNDKTQNDQTHLRKKERWNKGRELNYSFQ